MHRMRIVAVAVDIAQTGGMPKDMLFKHPPHVVRQAALVAGSQAHQRRLERFAHSDARKLADALFGHRSGFGGGDWRTAQHSPIHIGTQILATYRPTRGPLDCRAMFGRNAASASVDPVPHLLLLYVDSLRQRGLTAHVGDGLIE